MGVQYVGCGNAKKAVHIPGPHDLNKAVHCEHYQMTTVGEMVTKLTQAKKFTVVEAKDGFW